MSTVKTLLTSIGINISLLPTTKREQFSVVRKAFLATALLHHPDKGGDADLFRAAHEAFEALRDIHLAPDFVSYHLVADSTTAAPDVTMHPWDYYAHAAEVDMPSYRIEAAKSGLSKAKSGPKKDLLIPQGVLRVGSLLVDTGTYTRWNFLDCWRVPNAVQAGIPSKEKVASGATREDIRQALLAMDGVVIDGLSELDDEQLDQVVDQWANYRKPKSGEPRTPQPTTAVPKEGAIEPLQSTLFAQAPTFCPPRPGVDAPANALAGTTFVLTGTFPELGGGGGLSLGKQRAKDMLQGFGAKVTGSISGKTSYLLVGKDPGFAKMAKAKELSIPGLSTQDVADGLCSNNVEAVGNARLEEPIEVKSFSSGFRGSGLALKATPEQLAFVGGVAAAPQLTAPTGGAGSSTEAKSRKKKTSVIEGKLKTSPRAAITKLSTKKAAKPVAKRAAKEPTSEKSAKKRPATAKAAKKLSVTKGKSKTSPRAAITKPSTKKAAKPAAKRAAKEPTFKTSAKKSPATA